MGVKLRAQARTRACGFALACGLQRLRVCMRAFACNTHSYFPQRPNYAHVDTCDAQSTARALTRSSDTIACPSPCMHSHAVERAWVRQVPSRSAAHVS
eukprot:6210843-Pleurochrysis_carterae.AAC.1